MNTILSRRSLLENFGFATLIIAANKNSAFALPLRAEAAEWARSLYRISEQLLNQQISPEQWQNQVSNVYEKTKLKDILIGLDFEAVRAGMDITRPGGHWNQVFIHGLSSSNNKEKVITKIVALEKGRAVPPHGHENEVSAFLTLTGEFRTRLWNRVAVNKDSLDISKAFDGISGPGHWSTQSEEKTNVHWLMAHRNSFFLSVRLAKIDGTGFGRERILIGPDEAQEIREGIFRAPILDKQTWWEKYSQF